MASCKRSADLSGSIKCWGLAEILLASQGRICSMDLVNLLVSYLVSGINCGFNKV